MSIIGLIILLVVLNAIFGGKKGKKRKSTQGSGQTGHVYSKWSR